MKIKTLVPHVLLFNRPEGEVIDVENTTGEHLIKVGYAEEIKESRSHVKKSTDPKKEDK
ncbi:hypothetical protein [Bacillus thuringiensis]|uniref:hypothetical protein n=1 Tax=Bacillus thuringiensis TaxID=1428 RepID=UPI0016427BDE|nr:hypothetical protein [Bacillus thuringiensis]